MFQENFNYNGLQNIGSGTFGEVFVTNRQINGKASQEKVAIKMVFSEDKSLQQAKGEIHKMIQVKSRFVIQLYDFNFVDRQEQNSPIEVNFVVNNQIQPTIFTHEIMLIMEYAD